MSSPTEFSISAARRRSQRWRQWRKQKWNILVEILLWVGAVICLAFLLPYNAVQLVTEESSSVTTSLARATLSPLVAVTIALFVAGAGATLTRQLIQRRLSAELLQRFNSNDMYVVRRRAYRESLLWMAGDRNLLLALQVTPKINFVSGLSGPDKDPTVCVSQLLSFIVEMQLYYDKCFLDRESVRVLFADRFCWFVAFFRDLCIALERSQVTNQFKRSAINGEVYPMIPFPFIRTLENASGGGKRYNPSSVNAVEWLIDLLELHDHVQSLPSDQNPYAGTLFNRQGLRCNSHLRKCRIIIQTSKQGIRELTPNSKYLSTDCFVRLRTNGNIVDMPTLGFKSMASLAMLEYQFCTDRGKFHIFEYLGNEGSVDGELVRYWYFRLLAQGYTPRHASASRR